MYLLILKIYTKCQEIGMHEFKTSAYIADHLKKMGYEVQEHIGGGTGVVAVYDSR